MSRACICEHCLTIRDRLVVVPLGRLCRVCGEVPDRKALTVGEIRQVVRSWKRDEA